MPTITVVDKPSAINTNQTPASTAAQAARARAIAMLSGNQAPKTASPVPTPSNISVEELSAVKASEPVESLPIPEAQVAEGDGQTNNSVEDEKPKSVATEDKALSPQYAALARKEKALRSQVQQFKSSQMAFKAEQEASKAKIAEAESALNRLAKLKQDPWSVLNELGVSYDQLTASALNPPSPQDQIIAKLEAKINALEESGKQTVKQFEDQQTNSYKQAVNQIRNDATALVSQDPEFETIKATGSVGDVVDLIERTFKEEGTLLSVEDACKLVEEHLVDEAMKIAKIGKIQKRLIPAAPKNAAPKPQATQQSPQMKTLTNAVSATRPLTPRERAIAVAEGKKNW